MIICRASTSGQGGHPCRGRASGTTRGGEVPTRPFHRLVLTHSLPVVVRRPVRGARTQVACLEVELETGAEASSARFADRVSSRTNAGTTSIAGNSGISTVPPLGNIQGQRW